MGNISDIDDNAKHEADGPFEWIYVIIGTDFCCIRGFIITGLRKVNTSPYNADRWQSPVRPRRVYRILPIMLDMRQMDLSCVYM